MAWHGEIILDWVNKPDDPRVIEVGDFTYFDDGSFRVENRAFKKKEPIDCHFAAGHVFREAGSLRHSIWTPSGERFVFEFRPTLSGNRWIRWTPRAVDEVGTPDADATPSLRDRAILSIQDAAANLVGAVGWIIFALAVLGLLLGWIS